MSRRIRQWGSVLLVALALLRFVHVSWAGLTNIRGDYYASLPGAYVETVNPTLWDSPDMEGTYGYLRGHTRTYFHGPVQYLTLYYVAYLDSYAAIARLLLPVYAVLLGLSFWLMRRALSGLAPGVPVGVPVFASTFLFFPLLQAYVQREFEVVIFLALTAGLFLLVHDRRTLAGAVLAYAAWFKYLPLLYVGYLGLRRWTRATASFLLTSGMILAVSHAVFDLRLFVNNNVPDHALTVLQVTHYGFVHDESGTLVGEGFCHGWFEGEGTLANVRHGLCVLAARVPLVPPNVVYLLLCTAIAAIYLRAHVRLERAPSLDMATERWRRALEMSIVTAVWSCFFFNHYYYLIVLAIPFNVLLVRYLSAPSLTAFVLWGLAYLLVSAFVLPPGLLSWLTGQDAWAGYMAGGWYLYGELVLVALLLREYSRLTDQLPRENLAIS